MRKWSYSMFICFLLFSMSCDGNEVVTCGGEAFDPKGGMDFLLVIPVEGCSSCISQVKDFVKRNKTASNMGVLIDASMNKMATTIKNTEFADVTFVKVYQRSSKLSSEANLFPLLIRSSAGICDSTILDESNIRVELADIHFKIK